MSHLMGHSAPKAYQRPMGQEQAILNKALLSPNGPLDGTSWLLYCD